MSTSAFCSLVLLIAWILGFGRFHAPTPFMLLPLCSVVVAHISLSQGRLEVRRRMDAPEVRWQAPARATEMSTATDFGGEPKAAAQPYS